MSELFNGNSKKLKVCFVSSFPPRQCGIATYTQSVISALVECKANVEARVFAMEDRTNLEYPEIVIGKIREKVDADYIRAAETLNNSDIDLVSIQHEFGIFGGFNGNKILQFVKKIKKPVIITLHTLPVETKTPFTIKAKRFKSRQELLKKIFCHVDLITVMIESSKEYLVAEYDVSPDKIAVVPHGAESISGAEVNHFKEKGLPLDIAKDTFLITTFGLISPKKGLEYVIKAIPGIISANPGIKIKYLIAGRMHPKKGVEYLQSLKNLAKRLKIKDNIIFDSRYLLTKDIYSYLANSNLYITPYYVREQASSGTLSYAIGAHCCIISTPYLFALEMVKKRRIGELVEFKDSNSIETEIGKLINNPALIREYQKNSAKLAAEIYWPVIGKKLEKIYRDTI